MKTAARILVAVLATSAAEAQTGMYIWQVSLDGSDWQTAVHTNTGATVYVRLLAAWADVSGTDQGYAGGQFDGRIQNGASDAVTDIHKPITEDFGMGPRYAASVIGSDLKIDVETDLGEIGQGAGWLNPGQAARNFAAPGTYHSENPVVILTYTLVLGSSATDRIFDSVLNQTTGRAMAIYIDGAGTQSRLNGAAVSVHEARVTIPAPASLAFLAAAVWKTRRSR